MKISTKGRYSVRMMLELALHYEQNLLSVKTIGEKQAISEKYIEQIIALLNKAGLVRSQRGAAGGYKLAAAPGEITVGDILRVTEGAFEMVECVADNPKYCERREECVTTEIWLEMKLAMEAVVDNVTLADLVNRYKSKCNFIDVI